MFTIDEDRNIQFCETPEDGSSSFGSLKELTALADAREWSKAEVTGIWNSFAGVTPFGELKTQVMFKNRPYGLNAIWKAVQRLDPRMNKAKATQEPAKATTDPVESNEEKPTEVKKAAKAREPKAAKAEKPIQAKVPRKSAAKIAHRSGTKREEVIRLISRANGATAGELMEKTGWQAHSLRGFLSTIRSKASLAITSERDASRGTVYRLAS